MEGINPYNQEAEAALVGAFFLEPELVTECTIRPDQLYFPRLRLLYSAIRSLNEKGKPIDVIAIVEELGPQGVEGIGGISYITELAGSVPTTANFKFNKRSWNTPKSEKRSRLPGKSWGKPKKKISRKH